MNKFPQGVQLFTYISNIAVTACDRYIKILYLPGVDAVNRNRKFFIMPKPISCKCGSTSYRTEQSGSHIKAICTACNSYIQFIPQNNFTGETIMFYGKYKGKPLKIIPDDYFTWLYQNTKTSGSLKKYIEENIL